MKKSVVVLSMLAVAALGSGGVNAADPKPKDLSNKDEMSTLKDQEIFETIFRDMKDTTPNTGDKIGDDDFAVPTMPTTMPAA